MNGDPYRFVIRAFADLRGLRSTLRAWLHTHGVETQSIEDLLVAVSEVATNGIEASADRVAEVEAATDPLQVRVVVTNEGPWVPEARPPTDERVVLRERGRGLDIARALVDSVSFSRIDNRTRATLVKRRDQSDPA